MAVYSSEISQTTSIPIPAIDASKRTQWFARALTGIAVLFLAFDTVMKLAHSTPALEGTARLGYPPHHVLIFGLLELVCLTLYVVPRTATLGVVLWTGYLGGAIASNLRLELPLFSHVLFPTYIAALLWGGLFLRDARVKAFFSPFQKG